MPDFETSLLANKQVYVIQLLFNFCHPYSVMHSN